MNKLSSFFCFILVGTYLIVKVLILGFSPIRELYTLQEGEKCEVRAAAALWTSWLVRRCGPGVEAADFCHRRKCLVMMIISPNHDLLSPRPGRTAGPAGTVSSLQVFFSKQFFTIYIVRVCSRLHSSFLINVCCCGGVGFAARRSAGGGGFPGSCAAADRYHSVGTAVIILWYTSLQSVQSADTVVKSSAVIAKQAGLAWD